MHTRTEAVPPARVLIAELDSMEQANIFAGHATEADAVRTITGMLRAAMMVADRILVTDSMILDGAYFACVSPESLAHLLGVADHDLPITVLSSAATLKDALADKQADPGFEWQLRTLPTIGDERARRHWELWISASQRGSIDIEPWGAPIDGPLVSGGFLTKPPDASWSVTLGQAASRMLTQSLGVPRRSTFLGLSRTTLSEENATTRTDRDTAELLSVREWWLRTYLDELAARNHAGWLRFTSDDASPPLAIAPGRHVRRVSGAFLVLLSEAPPPVFATLTFVVRDRRAAFIAKPTNCRLRSLRYGAANALMAPNLWRDIGTAIVHLVVAAAAVAVAFPFLPKQMLGIESAWIAFAVVAVATAPWRDLIVLSRLPQTLRSAELVLTGQATDRARGGRLRSGGGHRA